MTAMQQHLDFAASLDGWATVPKAATEAVQTWQAASGLITDNPVPGLRDDVLNGTVGPKNVVKRLNDASMILAGQYATPKLVEEIAGPLAQRFSAAILDAADGIVADLGKQFDKYAAQVTQYAPLIPPGITAEQLLGSANAQVVEAWQMLGLAEATLEQIATFRAQLSTRYGYPEAGPQVAAWIAPVKTEEDLRRAALVWKGHDPIGRAGEGNTRPLPEVRGGRWRWLVDAGYTLACNDQHQAARVSTVLAVAA